MAVTRKKPLLSDKLVSLMEGASSFCESYRSANIDPAHRRADNAYHGILENESEYDKRGRSKLFIPKTRDHVRKWTTNLVNSFYVSDDIVTLYNPSDMEKQRFTNEVFNNRLELSTSFFRFLSYASHCHTKYGNCVGKTGWIYEEETESFNDVDEETGESVTIEASSPLVDKPFFEVVPFENVQYDYRVISTDPMQDSPFLRHFAAWYVEDVEEMFASGAWKRPPKGANWMGEDVPSSTTTVRASRQGRMADPQNETTGVGGTTKDNDTGVGYKQVWVVENYFRVKGVDWTFISIGDKFIVTKPEMTAEKYPHGKRPFALSQFDPEAFRSYSDGLPEMMRHLQTELNAIRNQRRDNVSLVLNRGHYVRRGAGIQLDSLLNSRPGMVVMGNDVSQNGIRPMEYQDVTASAYREEQTAAADIEEISGQSQSMMMGGGGGNRTTATEAAISASSAGEIEGFVVKSFVETFVRPLLEMFMDNLVAYENDPVVLQRASDVTGLEPSPQNLVRCEVVVNAGMGSINKELRASRLERIVDRLIQAQKDPTPVLREWLPLVGIKNVDAALGEMKTIGGEGQGAPTQGGMGAEAPSVPPQGNPAFSPAVQALAGGNAQIGGFAGDLMR